MVSEKIWGSAIGAFVAYGKDGATLVPVKVNADGELVVNLEAATVNIGDVDVLSSALPTGAATSANQAQKITPATVTGTCTAAYVAALTLSCQHVPNKTIIVVNTHATLTMKYRIRGYAKSGSAYYNEIQAEATLAASTSQPHVIENSYDTITVEVIDGSGHATYAIDYCGGQ